jgi:hypothetical protein
MATAFGPARGARAACISTLALAALAASAGGVSAAPPAPFTVNPTSLAFADTTINSTDVQTLTISTGRKDAVIYVTTTFGPYTVTGGTCLTAWVMQVPASTDCTLQVTFAPGIAGDYPGTMNLYSCQKFVIVGNLPTCDRLRTVVTVDYTGKAVNPA